jgi:aminoglycoside 6'-N-acetyltransferase
VTGGELRGQRVVLTPTAAQDAPALRAIHASEEVARWWDDPPPEFPDLADDEVELFTIHHAGEIAGLIQVYEETDPKYRYAGLDLFVAAAHQRQGVGSEAIALLIAELCERRGHHRLTIDPAAANAAAIACYGKLGFRPVGVLHRAERDRDGRGWHDQLLMELVRDNR